MGASTATSSQQTGRILLKFRNAAEQEAATIEYWSTRTINQRLEALAELLRDPHHIRLTESENDVPQASPGPSVRTLRKFRSIEERDAEDTLNLSPLSL
jgi:hypothetical protein